MEWGSSTYRPLGTPAPAEHQFFTNEVGKEHTAANPGGLYGPVVSQLTSTRSFPVPVLQ